ncbi:MAG: hypothetical protein MK289_11325 [Trichodesmium sp. ALOHA_ZT_67]|nr:hypothetical protein [Trichodesmium sp. ALOHA_ZT_67]
MSGYWRFQELRSSYSDWVELAMVRGDIAAHRFRKSSTVLQRKTSSECRWSSPEPGSKTFAPGTAASSTGTTFRRSASWWRDIERPKGSALRESVVQAKGPLNSENK